MGNDDSIVLFGAGATGRNAIEYYGSKSIRFFVDNFKAGQYIDGIPVISLDDCKVLGYKGPITVTTDPTKFPEICEQLRLNGYSDVNLIRPDAERWFPQDPRLVRFKDIHKGERCFLIGNGPSLRMDDLEKIRKSRDVSFGFNGIYKAFELTDWRPDYFMAGDATFLDNRLDVVRSLDCICLVDGSNTSTQEFYTDAYYDENVFCFRTEWLKVDNKEKTAKPQYQITDRQYPAFSANPDRFIYTGGTIVYAAMQWAAYMGFSEMVLLGVDLNYKKTIKLFSIPDKCSMDSSSDTDHFISNYYEQGDVFMTHDVKRMQIAFDYAERYSRGHGFRIYNATRGGKLEVFERVDFKGLF